MIALDVSYLQIEPTTRCNFACGFCAGRHMPQRDMPLERLEEILRAIQSVGEEANERGAAPSPRPSPDKGEGEDSGRHAERDCYTDPRTPIPDPCRDSGLRHVELQGEGEPMLHPQFFEMAEMIRRMHPLAKISLITNGSLLNAENVERILESGFYKLMVSIESPDPQAFAEIRGGKLAKVIEGIRLLIGARDSGLGARECAPHAPREDGHHAERDEYTGPAVGLAITVLRRTMHELPRILDLYDELGLDGGITLQPLQTMPVYTQHYDAEMRSQMLTPDDRRKFQDELRQNARVREFFTRRADEGGRSPFSHGASKKGTVPAGFYDELFAGWEPRSGECPWLARGLYVAYNGAATGCCFIKDTASDGFGELSPATAETIAAKREAMQSELRSGHIPLPCAGCPTAEAIVAQTSHATGSSHVTVAAALPILRRG